MTGKVQWADEETGTWHDVLFGSSEEQTAPQGTLRLTFKDQAVKKDPSYYSHFALSRIKDGRPQVLEFPEGTTWKNTFADGVQVDAGQYMLLSGTRLANGGVMASLEIQTLPNLPLKGRLSVLS